MLRKKATFVQDTVVKVVLKDASASATSDDTGCDASTSAEASKNKHEYFIHKNLLSSLSPEFDKHTNNDMKEGREGVLALSEVDIPTLEAFLDWAYFKDYTLEPVTSWLTVLPHTKIYVFADRFNIPILKDLAYSRIDTLAKDRKIISDTADITALLQAIEYAYENLLFRTTALKKDTDTLLNSASEKIEKLLKYFAGFVAFTLETFRDNVGFRKLVATSPEFAEALIISSKPATIPPWVQSELDSGSAQAGSSAELSVTLPSGDENHILYRDCGSCGFQGVGGIQCKCCSAYDHYIGVKVDFNGSTIGKAGGERVSGTKTNLQYTCLWCKVKSTYSTTAVPFYTPIGGGQGSYQEIIGYSSCGKCKQDGHWGSLSIP